MSNTNKFEQMLELLINEDKEAAQELFHEIVVEKSRDIYEGLLEDESDVEETTDEEVDETTDEEVDETTDEEVDESDDEEVEEGFDLDEFEVEAEPAMGGDAGDDMMADLGMDDEGDDDEEGEEPEGDVEDRVEDLEDALDDLKAEFEKMMAGDDEEPGDEAPEEEGYAFEATDEEVDEASDEEVDEASDDEVEEATDEEVEEAKGTQTAGEEMREYVEKVAPAKMGDNGVNTKSIVAGKNDMGGTTANILSGKNGAPGSETGELKGSGLLKGKPTEDNAGNINVPGGKAGGAFSKKEPGHGAEKAGSKESADNKQSLFRGRR